MVPGVRRGVLVRGGRAAHAHTHAAHTAHATHTANTAHATHTAHSPTVRQVLATTAALLTWKLEIIDIL